MCVQWISVCVWQVKRENRLAVRSSNTCCVQYYIFSVYLSLFQVDDDISYLSWVVQQCFSMRSMITFFCCSGLKKKRRMCDWVTDFFLGQRSRGMLLSRRLWLNWTLNQREEKRMWKSTFLSGSNSLFRAREFTCFSYLRCNIRLEEEIA